MSHTFVDTMMEALKSGEMVSPVEQLVGMRLVEHGRGEATYELAVTESHSNPMGMVQGGIASVMADAAMAMSTTTLTNDEMRVSAVTTVDLFSRFIRPVKANKVEVLRAEARVLRAGRQLVWAECDLYADGDLVGKFNATGIKVSFEQKEGVRPSDCSARRTDAERCRAPRHRRPAPARPSAPDPATVATRSTPDRTRLR